MTRDETIADLTTIERMLASVMAEAFTSAAITPRQRGFLWGAACDLRAVVRMLEMEDQLNDTK